MSLADQITATISIGGHDAAYVNKLRRLAASLSKSVKLRLTAFVSACEDAGIEGLVGQDLRAALTASLGEAGFNAWAKRTFEQVSVTFAIASWRTRGSHAKKSAPSQQRSPTLSAGVSGTLMVTINS